MCTPFGQNVATWQAVLHRAPASKQYVENIRMKDYMPMTWHNLWHAVLDGYLPKVALTSSMKHNLI